MMNDRKPLDGQACALITALTMLWGFQQVTIKLAAADISLVMQAGLRSVIATVMLLAWARVRAVALFDRDGTLASGLAVGALFAAEFVFIYAGLAYTTVSRMNVFIYTAPCFTALMLPVFVPSERLQPWQWVGIGVAFAGVVVAFADGFAIAQGATFRGDLYGVTAAFLWAATIVLIRATKLASASATKTLFYQLAASAVALPLVSVAMGEPGVLRASSLAIAVLAYQGIIVAFASYLVWFWLLTRYFAARLSVFTLLTPLFGILSGVIFLAEPITPVFVAAGALVLAGITLVNFSRRSGSTANRTRLKESR